MLEIAIKELEKAAFDFYNMTKIKIVLFSDENSVLYSYPDTMAPLCEEIRKNKELEKKCFECDKMGFKNCHITKSAYIYNCHAGLTEAVVPIYENSVIIGHMMLGQVLDKKNEEKATELINNICTDYGYDRDMMMKKLSKTRKISSEAIQSAANIMSMCACYLYTNKIIKNKTDILAYQLKDYIDNHLSEDLSVKNLCRIFYISKTKLYYLSKNAFNCGVSDYIRLKRIDEAKRLLTETKMPVSHIAEETGIGDANYFSRIFKTDTGMSPGTYRKKNIQKDCSEFI